MSEEPRRCYPYIDAAGFPQRGPEVLYRERHLYPLMINRMMGRGKGFFRDDPGESLTMDMLEKAFAENKGTVMPAAAFVAGRCQPDAPEDRERLTALLRGLLASLPVERLGAMAPSYIEAAMSLALRGDPEAARTALRPLVGEYAATIMESYLAAFYLAQLGDPSGYPAMLDSLRSDSEHDRLMAARCLIGFKPYDGQVVQGKTVDIRAALIERLQDTHAYVRVEVPYLMAEARLEGLQELLQPVAKRDRDKEVRRSARQVLDDLAEQGG